MDDCDWMLSVEKACDWLRIEPGVTWKFFSGTLGMYYPLPGILHDGEKFFQS